MRGLAENFLPKILPLLKRDISVQAILQRGGAFTVKADDTSRAVLPMSSSRSAHTITLWVLGEMLHGQGGNLWKNYALALEQQIPEDRASIEKRWKEQYSRFPSIDRPYMSESAWLTTPGDCLARVCLAWITTHPPDQWQPLIDIIDSTGDLVSTRQAPFLQALCQIAEKHSSSPKIWTDLLEKLPTPTASSVAGPALPEQLASTLAPAARWHLTRHGTSLALPPPPIPAKVLSATQMAELLTELPREDLGSNAQRLFDWLHLHKQSRSIQTMIEKLQVSGPPLLKKEIWHLLTAWCRSHDLADLAESCSQEAQKP